MKCSKCGTYNNEDREKCRTCGTELNEQEVEDTIEKKSKVTKKSMYILGILICLIFAFSTVAAMLIPTTVDVSVKHMEKYAEPYTVQEAYTVDVPYTVQEAYTVDVPYTATHQEAVYKTVYHDEPIYKTLSTYNVDHVAVKNVYDIKKEFTGRNFWGTAEYKVTAFYYNNLEKDERIFYEAHGYTFVENYEVIIGYNNYSEEIIDEYITKETTEDKETTEYKYVTKTRSETRHRDITEYRSEIRYRDVTKTRYLEREIVVIETVNCSLYEKILFEIDFYNTIS